MDNFQLIIENLKKLRILQFKVKCKQVFKLNKIKFMEQSQYTNIPQPQPYQQETKSKVPIFVVIISWLIRLMGFFSFFSIVPVIILSGIAFGISGSGNGFLLVIPLLILGVGLIIVSSGIRRMRRWALYTFTVITVLYTGSSLYFYSLYFLTKADVDLRIIVSIGLLVINVLTLVYLWSIYKKFK